MTNNFTNVEAEAELLGALLLNSRAFYEITFLNEGHFSEPLHARIFKKIESTLAAGHRITPTLLKEHFDNDEALADIGGGKYLFKLAAIGTNVVNIKEHAYHLVRLFKKRNLSDLCYKTLSDLAITDLSPSEYAVSLLQALQRQTQEENEDVFLSRRDIRKNIVSEMAQEKPIYSTGMIGFDKAMLGGLHAGKSYGFAARKKMGKTILASTISHHLGEAGVKHLCIWGEMSAQEIEQRLLAYELQVPNSTFLEKYDNSFAERAAARALNSPTDVFCINAPGLTFEDLKYYVVTAKMQKKITGFILDYWQLVGGKPKGKSTAEHLDEIAQWIADSCRKYELWSVVMAQINQEGNTRGGEGIRLAFDQVYVLHAPNDDPGRIERWLEMSDTRYTPWRSIGSANRPGLYLNKLGPYFTETHPDALGGDI